MSAKQLELFRVRKAAAPRAPRRTAEAHDWGLWVNEVGIFASGIAKDRWLDFITLRSKDERLTPLRLGPAGGEWHVMCGTKADAADALETFLGAGFHRAHVKAGRLSACRAKVEKRRAEIVARLGGAL